MCDMVIYSTAQSLDMCDMVIADIPVLSSGKEETAENT